MSGNIHISYEAHLRAIRSAIAALALAVLSASLIIRGDEFGFWFGIITLLLVVYSFVPTAANG